MRRVHLYISGMVQGVFFRAETRASARTLGIKGWVSNLAEGGVEVLAEGEDEKIKEFISFSKIGPSGARVREVKVIEESYKGEFDDFEIRHTI